MDLLLKSIENNTKEHWKNYYKDVPIECIYDDLVIDINEIKRLTEQNKKYKEVIDKLEFIKNRAISGATQETINKLAIDFVNSYLMEEVE